MNKKCICFDESEEAIKIKEEICKDMREEYFKEEARWLRKMLENIENEGISEYPT